MLIMSSFKKSLIVEQFQGNYLIKTCIFLSIHFSVSDNEDIYISLYKRLQHIDKKILVYILC